MKLSSLITSLLPTFETGQLVDDLRLLQDELTRYTLPVYKTSRELTKGAPFTNEFAKEFDQVFKERVGEYKDYMIPTIDTVLNRSLQHVEWLVESTETLFTSKDVMRSALSFSQAHVIQFTELMQFISGYSRRLLNVLVALENRTLEDAQGKSLARDKAWIEEHRQAFIMGINLLAKRPKDIQREFEKVPDMLLSEASIASAESTLGKGAVDPLRVGIIPFRFNPIYHIRMAVVQWQVNSQKLAAQELETLELRLLHLKQKRVGQEDSKLEQQIDYTQGRVDKLRFKLKKLEEKGEDE